MNVAPCGLVENDRRFIEDPEHGRNKVPLNIGQYLSQYRIQHPSRQPLPSATTLNTSINKTAQL
jgi:hypothetical protein